MGGVGGGGRVGGGGGKGGGGGGGVGGREWTLMGGEYHMIDATNQR